MQPDSPRWFSVSLSVKRSKYLPHGRGDGDAMMVGQGQEHCPGWKPVGTSVFQLLHRQNRVITAPVL